MGLILENYPSLYFYNPYADEYTVIAGDTLPSDKEAEHSISSILYKGMRFLNYVDGDIYGIIIDQYDKEYGNIVALRDNVEILREGEAINMLVVNDEIVFLNAGDYTLRKMSIEGENEEVLVDEAVYYPLVYKDIIIFHREADNECLYSVPKAGGEITKLNDIASYYPVLYKDWIYYCGKDGDVSAIHKIKPDGSEDTVIVEVDAAWMNVCNDKLYFVDQEQPDRISVLNLTKKKPEIEILDLTEKLKTTIIGDVGNDEIIDYQITEIDCLNLTEKCMLFRCSEIIDGQNYRDYYIYDLKGNEVVTLYGYFPVTDMISPIYAEEFLKENL